MSLRSVLFSLSICLLHFEVFNIAGKGISIGILLIPLYFASHNVFSSYRTIKSGFALLLAVAITAFLHSLLFSNNSLNGWIEWFKSLMNIFLLSSLFPIFYSNSFDVKQLGKDTRFAFMVVALSVIFQFIMINYLGVTGAINLLGKFQLFYQFTEDLNASYYVRMKSFYLEPSFAALVIGNLFVGVYCLTESRVKLFRFLVLLIICSLLIKSAWLYMFIFFILMYMIGSLRSYFLLLFLVVVPLLDISFLRLEEISLSNDALSSGFMRVVLPIKTIINMLADGRIFGIGLGHWDLYLAQEWKDYKESSMSNAFLLLIGWFGIFGILGIYRLMLYYSKGAHAILFMGLLILNLLNNGGILTFSYFLMMVILPFVYQKHSRG